MLQDKYKMTQKENISYAKRNLVENIYNAAKLEGLNVTFPETYAIVNKAILEQADIDEVNTVLNLKHAWQLVIKTIDDPIDLDYLLKIHAEISKDEALSWGELRTGQVRIGGTDYVPPIPNQGEVIEALEKFNKLEIVTERAICRMLWMMKTQIFWDGNKRVANIIANKDLIQHGRGILSVKEKDIVEFNQLLNKYYSFGEERELKQFLYEKTLDGYSVRKIELEKPSILKEIKAHRLNYHEKSEKSQNSRGDAR